MATTKPMFDADALIALFESATAQQGAQLRKATGDATLAALQGRELTLANIRSVLKTVTQAASTGAARNAADGIDAAGLLDQAVAGIDDAMLKAVQANRTALTTLLNQGADMREKHLSKALADLEKMEDTMFDAFRKTAAGAAAPLADAWGQVLQKMQPGATQAGTQASEAAEQMAAQMQTALRSTRAASMRAAQALAESYGAMVSGVLIGMQEALQAGSAAKKSGAKSKP